MGIGTVTIYIKLLRTTFRKNRIGLLVLTVIGFFNSILDAIGIGIIIPLFSIFVHDANASTNFITRSTVRIFSFFHLSFNLYTLLGFMAMLFIGKAIGEFFVVYLRVRITANFEKEKRIDLYRRTLDCRWDYLLKQNLGYLENVIMSDVAATQGLLKQFCGVAPNFVSFIVYLAIALKISFPTTIATLVMGSIMLGLYHPVIMHVKKYFQRRVDLQKIIAHRVNENVGGMKTLKAMGLESQVVAREDNAFGELRDISIKSAFVQQLGASIVEPFTFIFIAIVFAYSYGMPQFSLPNFVVVIYIIQRIFTSVRKTQGSWNMMATALPHVFHVLALEEATQKNKEEDDFKEPFQFVNEIQFCNVSFAYNEHEKILSDVSFAVKKNEMMGIIGPSGAGKTTIVDLMLRFFIPQQGNILIDGKDIMRSALIDLRKNIGYMSQDIFLMNGTVAENIKFFRDDITDDDMMRAAKLANVYEFIQGLSDGFDTFIGERGVLLSGGQRQRIVLARILASRPQVLILDEATSALDTESEIMIKKSLESLRKEVTVIIIAHRLSTIMGVDNLVVMEKGCVIEQGNPAVLLSDEHSYFYKIKSLVDTGEMSEILK